ncbi:MAG: inorganic triphosphatase [Janthinobacterium lividum]
MSMEIELKLAIDPAAIATLRNHPLLGEYARQAPVDETLETIYYDTPDFALQRQQAALRVRRTADGWVQTLKAGGSVDNGLHRRHEWESAVSTATLDLPALIAMLDDHPQWQAMLASPELGARLVPVFATRFRRTAWLLHLPGQAVVECALDEGEVRCGALQAPICEVELELKAGQPDCLAQLATQLQAIVPMRASNVSKAERGYRLAAQV